MKILALAHTVWTDRWLNRQQLLSRIGRQLPILYSNAPWYTWSRHDPRWGQSPWFGLIELRDNVAVDVVPRWMTRSPRLSLWDRWVVSRAAARWRGWLESVGTGPLVLHLFHPEFEVYIEALRPDRVVYHPYDLYEHMPGWTEWQHQAEQRTLEKADLIVTSSAVTAHRLEQRSGKPITLVHNGADTKLFAAARAAALPPPADLAAIPEPRIGYIGSLQPTVDLLLLADLARRHPEWHFVFVGDRSPTVDAVTEEGMRQCKTLANVHFLGMKPREQVPAYALNMTVNILSWRVGQGFWADAAYPLKLHEYLACGRSVVTSDLVAVRPFADMLRIAGDVDDWEHALGEAIAGRGPGTPQIRIATAEQNSWDERAEQLLAALRSMEKQAPSVGYQR
jgi:glycosyltransferase involved in cell wall biosynthesis